MSCGSLWPQNPKIEFCYFFGGRTKSKGRIPPFSKDDGRFSAVFWGYFGAFGFQDIRFCSFQAEFDKKWKDFSASPLKIIFLSKRISGLPPLKFFSKAKNFQLGGLTFFSLPVHFCSNRQSPLVHTESTSLPVSSRIWQEVKRILAPPPLNFFRGKRLSNWEA